MKLPIWSMRVTLVINPKLQERDTTEHMLHTHRTNLGSKKAYIYIQYLSQVTLQYTKITNLQVNFITSFFCSSEIISQLDMDTKPDDNNVNH